MPRPKTKRVDQELTAHVDVRMSAPEKAELALFCEEHGLVVAWYVRECVRNAMRTTRREEYLRKLRDEGYHTAAVGKWHLGMNWVVRPGACVTELAIEPREQVFNVEYTEPIKSGPTSVGLNPRVVGASGGALKYSCTASLSPESTDRNSGD